VLLIAVFFEERVKNSSLNRQKAYSTFILNYFSHVTKLYLFKEQRQ